MFDCVVCAETFESEYVPARDFRTGGFVCEPCETERKDWRSRLVFPDLRMAELPNGESW